MTPEAILSRGFVGLEFALVFSASCVQYRGKELALLSVKSVAQVLLAYAADGVWLLAQDRAEILLGFGDYSRCWLPYIKRRNSQ